MTKTYVQKSHEDPRISVNKLAEYLSTNKAARRTRILKEAKFPPTFQTIRYDPAREIVQRFLSGAIPNTQSLQTVIDTYSKLPASDDYEQRTQKSNVEALGYFLTLAPTLDFGDSEISLGAHAPPKITISDVAISVRPDLLLVTSKKGANLRGAIKLNISKGAVHTKDSSEYAGTLVRHYLTGKHGAECDYRLCYTLDVFGKKLTEAPKSVTNRMKDVESACAEIARQWESITND
jgi:hypothetical protein